MIKILTIILVVAAGLHGLIHLMGFTAYWPLAKIQELPYKTNLLNGRLEPGAAGMRLFAIFWLLAAVGFIFASLALAFDKSYWAPLMLASVLLSLLLCILDWSSAFRGALIDLFLLFILAVVFGLRVPPSPLPAFSASSAPVTTVPFPEGLPLPVERYLHQTYGDQLPLYTSTVISGRGTLRFMGITFPARMRFSHHAASDYRHYLEATFYGFPIMKVNESYLDGHSRLELPFGVVENDPNVDSAANQGLWAEIASYPAVFATDPRLSWEAVDDTTALLFVPFGAEEQQFTVRFNPQTGELSSLETQRYFDAKLGKVRWTAAVISLPDHLINTATWEFEDSPWLTMTIEEIVFNSDLSEYMLLKGP